MKVQAASRTVQKPVVEKYVLIELTQRQAFILASILAHVCDPDQVLFEDTSAAVRRLSEAATGCSGQWYGEDGSDSVRPQDGRIVVDRTCGQFLG